MLRLICTTLCRYWESVLSSLDKKTGLLPSVHHCFFSYLLWPSRERDSVTFFSFTEEQIAFARSLYWQTVMYCLNSLSSCQVFVNLTTARVIWDEGSSVENTLLSIYFVGKSVAHFLDWWLTWEVSVYFRWSHFWADGPGWYRKAEWASQEEEGSRQHFFRAFALKFLSWISSRASLWCTLSHNVKWTLDCQCCFWSWCLSH